MSRRVSQEVGGRSPCQDRLTRFGFGYFEQLLPMIGCELVVMNRDAEQKPTKSKRHPGFVMRRAVKVSIEFATANKRRQVAALLEAYRGAVNFYIRSLWVTRGKLDKSTLARLQNTRFSARYKSQALKQAIEIVIATKKSAKELGIPASRPVFRGSAVLDSKFAKIEEGRGTFDLVVRLSTLHKGHRISVPTKKTAMFHKWANRPLAKLIQGCRSLKIPWSSGSSFLTLSLELRET